MGGFWIIRQSTKKHSPLVDFTLVRDGVVAVSLLEDFGTAQEERQEGQARLL